MELNVNDYIIIKWFHVVVVDKEQEKLLLENPEKRWVSESGS